MSAYISLGTLASYSALVASGHADTDLPASDRVEVVRTLSLTIGRLSSYGRDRDVWPRATAHDALFAVCGDISIPAYQRCIDIIDGV